MESSRVNPSLSGYAHFIFLQKEALIQVTTFTAYTNICELNCFSTGSVPVFRRERKSKECDHRNECRGGRGGAGSLWPFDVEDVSSAPKDLQGN